MLKSAASMTVNLGCSAALAVAAAGAALFGASTESIEVYSYGENGFYAGAFVESEE